MSGRAYGFDSRQPHQLEKTTCFDKSSFLWPFWVVAFATGLREKELHDEPKQARRKQNGHHAGQPAAVVQYIIGQDAAKRHLAVSVYNHYKRLAQKGQKGSHDADEVEIEKSNIIMVGSTDTGFNAREEEGYFILCAPAESASA